MINESMIENKKDGEMFYRSLNFNFLTNQFQYQKKMNWTEKQNQYHRDTYHVRTRQYQNNGTTVKDNPMPRRIQQNTSVIENQKYHYNPSYLKNGKIDKMDKMDKAERVDGRYENTRNREHVQSAFENSKLVDQSFSNQLKTQNARKRCFEQRSNNIDNINDQINSLLNMVRHNKYRETSKDGFDNSNQLYERSLSNNRSINNYEKQKRAGISPYQIRQKSYSKKDDYVSKMSQGERTRVTLQQQKSKEVVRKNMRRDISYDNEEDRDHNYPKQNNKKQYEMKNIRSKDKFEDRVLQSVSQNTYEQIQKDKYGKRCYTPSQNKDRARKQIGRIVDERQRRADTRFNPAQDQNNSAIKTWGQFDEKQRKSNQFTSPKYDKTPPKSIPNSGSIMPLTLMSSNQKSKEKVQDIINNSANNTRVIDDQIRRIKSKMQESQSNNAKLQEVLTAGRGRERDRNYNYSEKINYSQLPETRAVNKFQLKIYPVQNQRENVVRIAQRLSGQVEIDGRLRAARERFEKLVDSQKWQKFEDTLKLSGLRMTINQIKQLISISPDESNAINRDISPKHANNLAQLFCQSQKHWQDQVIGCATMRGLKQQNFDISQIDLNKKGNIRLQDIVSFVNQYTGHYYKNKDLSLIYRRLKLLQGNRSQSGVGYNTFLRTVSI